MQIQQQIVPKFNVHLPDGDERQIKKVFVEQEKDGSWDLYVTVSPNPRDKDRDLEKLSLELVSLYSIVNEMNSKVIELAEKNKLRR